MEVFLFLWSYEVFYDSFSLFFLFYDLSTELKFKVNIPQSNGMCVCLMNKMAFIPEEQRRGTCTSRNLHAVSGTDVIPYASVSHLKVYLGPFKGTISLYQMLFY